MSSNHLTDRRQREQDPYGGSPMSSDGGSASLHESWVSGQFDLSFPPVQQDHHQQIHVEQFAPNWPLPSVPLAGLSNSRPPIPVPPNNTPMVTPEESLEDVSLDGPSSFASIHQEVQQPQHIIMHEELQGRMQAPIVQSAYLVPPGQLRPSSFEIMGCFTPVRLEHSVGPDNGHAGRPGASRHQGPRYGVSRIPTPYPLVASPAAMLSAGIRRVRVIPNPEVATGGRTVRANQNGTLSISQHNGRSLPERYSTRRLVVLIITAGFTLASFLLLAQSVAVITVFRASGKPVSHGYVVECVLSTIIFLPSITGLVWVLAGGSIVFPYTLRSPFDRRQPAQLKEFELGSMHQLTTANDQDIRSGEVPHQQPPPLPMSRPLRGPVESRELLLQAAVPNATVAASTTQTSIMTELCNAVSAPDSRP
ncbi:hypothetical protein VMCG_10222 [Cytospora schulzeri]|uniref:Uncharacterized protein n=1 Tax=Cytospora schulzeri TaxID=448051 RepID=A0A423VEP4_9PEZI|nr:hypothetical protein VMCG_10222 [Valsa malicola]